ncbi:protein of unknown function [Cupriavidus taiwanensis]|uniref:Uncharacterized protein n=1 Tax=Cupriavidus taiwanensis TaxID=164546 RepID=A0A9Q7UTZ4_9BURK|nr:protein of unknown function [Cupriavidus taiwanensis]
MAAGLRWGAGPHPGPSPACGEWEQTGPQDPQGLKSDAFRLGQTYHPYLDSSHPRAMPGFLTAKPGSFFFDPLIYLPIDSII